MSSNRTLVWFRRDLRIADNPALAAAAERGTVIPIFIWAPDEEAPWPPGSASRWWLHQSLTRLREQLVARGSDLIVRQGATVLVLEEVLRKTGADAVFWNRRYEPAVVARDMRVKTVLRERGLKAESFSAGLLFEPWAVTTKQGKPFQVFTPYWRACQALPAPAKPTAEPTQLLAPDQWPPSEPLESLALEPKIDWAAEIRATWQPGEVGAQDRLRKFLAGAIDTYRADRDLPDQDGTSSLSPHLHFGEIGSRQIWHAVQAGARRAGRWELTRDEEVFLKEVGWREFAHHLLFHFPHIPDRPLRPEFERFPWAPNSTEWKAWRKGRTGYPIVDAGMRQLWATGWMHNRVRMIVASFLVKDLLIPWQHGAKWFWDTLVDADLANNTLGWQWSAGCGADAAPYYRVFNPILQGEKFDPSGAYVRRWVPELAHLPSPWIHKPWDAPTATLAEHGIELGRTYPHPIVKHAEARLRALEAYATLKQ